MRPFGDRPTAAATALATALLAALAGCTTRPGPTAGELPHALDPPDGGAGRIYVYREADPVLSANVPDVVVNGRRIGELRPGEVLFRDAAPGRYELRLSTDPEHVVVLRVLAGRARYVAVRPRWQGFGWRLRAARSDREAARTAIRDLVVVPPRPRSESE